MKRIVKYLPPSYIDKNEAYYDENGDLCGMTMLRNIKSDGISWRDFKEKYVNSSLVNLRWKSQNIPQNSPLTKKNRYKPIPVDLTIKTKSYVDEIEQEINVDIYFQTFCIIDNDINDICESDMPIVWLSASYCFYEEPINVWDLWANPRSGIIDI